MKIRTFDVTITPPMGTPIAGYGPEDVSFKIHDNLMMNGLLLDDGTKKAALLSFDLLGLDGCIIHSLRKECAAILGSEEKDIVISCTHTHGGPHTRSQAKVPLLQPYCDELVMKVAEGMAKAAKEEFTECNVYFYSVNVDVNINRRYCGPENHCRFLPKFRSLEPLADGVTDQEAGILYFQDAATKLPLEIVVNYAAHPLASHAPGLGGHAITADYPAVLRTMINEATGSHCTFVSGACGDQFPKDSEIGWQNLDEFAKPLARAVIAGICEAARNPEKFKLENPLLQTRITPFTAKARANFPDGRRRVHQQGLKEYDMELHFLAVGDIAFVGVPGELLAEIGLEIKWHSPFRRTYVLYNSTDYVSYICHANAFVSGGYEAAMQQIEYKGGLKLLNAAVDTLFEMHDQEINVPPYWPEEKGNK